LLQTFCTHACVALQVAVQGALSTVWQVDVDGSLLAMPLTKAGITHALPVAQLPAQLMGVVSTGVMVNWPAAGRSPEATATRSSDLKPLPEAMCEAT
jgi:hypothetical protein